MYLKHNNLNYRTFVLFFPYSGPFNILSIQNAGHHWGDLEHLTLEYTDDGDILRVYFGGHGDADGRWVDIKDVEKDGNNIIVYVAKNSHAFYPYIGTYFRLYGLANDIAQKGIEFIPSKYIKINSRDSMTIDEKEQYGAFYFCGKLGRNGIDSLVNKGWFSNMDKSESPPRLMSKSQTVAMDIFKIISNFVLLFLVIIIGEKFISKFEYKLLYYGGIGVLYTIIIQLLKYIISKVE